MLIATNDSKKAVAQRQALDNINRLAKSGAPDKALQAAYNELIESVKEGNEEAIQKAIKTAVNEKSRYVAERITRTEMARAYADGFIAKMNGDDDIVAVKFKLSGRHPTFDICDMYAKADMYNLGAGIYPKDKLPPLPIHPHCLCRYVEIYTGEVDTGKQRERVREAGDKWLHGLNEYQRQKVLGIDGVKAWKGGKDWRDYAYGYTKHTKGKTRLDEVVKELKEPAEPLGDRHIGKKSAIEQKTIDGLSVFSYPDMTKAQNEIMLTRQRELLTYAMNENNSNEVMFLLDEKLNRVAVLKGSEDHVDVTAMMINHLGWQNLQMLHNHPRGSSFSVNDIITLIDYDCLKGISLITNRGRIESLQKAEKYDKMISDQVVQEILHKIGNQENVAENDAVKQILSKLVRMRALSWKK